MARLDPERVRKLVAVAPDLRPGAVWFGPEGVWMWSGEEWVAVESGVGEECRWCGRVRPGHTEGCPVRALAEGIARSRES